MRESQQSIGNIYDKQGNLLAIVVSWPSFGTGVSFVTPDDLQQQVGIMKRKRGEVIPAHTHLPVPRSLRGTQEVLIILKGSMRADIFDSNKSFIQSVLLSQGDIIVLVSGGHGFEVLESVEFLEVKQGPYVEGKDKEIFNVDIKELH